MEDPYNNITNATNTCFKFSHTEMEIAGVAQAVAGIVSCIGCVLIFSIITVFKWYRQSSQRMVLYLNTAAFLNCTSFVVRGLGYEYSNNDWFCMGVAYFGQLTGGCILAAISCIIAELAIQGMRTGKRVRWLELVYLGLIFVLPPMVSLLPFINNGYGQSGAWCWFRVVDDECNKLVYGSVLQYLFWYVPLYTVILAGGVIYTICTLVITWKMKKISRTYTSSSQTLAHQKILHELHLFRWYPLIYFFINLIPLATRIEQMAKPKEPTFTLWVISGVIEGLQGLFLAAAFTLNKGAWKKLKPASIKINCYENWGLCYDSELFSILPSTLIQNNNSETSSEERPDIGISTNTGHVGTS